MSRSAIIDALLARLGAAPRPVEASAIVFNPALAQTLALDPAATALLADMTMPMAVDAAGPSLFRATERGTLMVSPALLSRPALLGVVVRWAQEAACLLRAGGGLHSAARHGAALIARLDPDARAELRAWIPAPLWNGDELDAGVATRLWLAAALGGGVTAQEAAPTELSLPIETLLESGGDARIATAPASGVNRYGAASRPRPEAVHFSSSTASSVSPYAFAALDRLRRVLLSQALFQGLSAAESGRTLANAISRELLAMHGLTGDDADVVLAPSGTDTELLAVAIALAAGDHIANVLIAPDETGRSVGVAAAGRYFQEGASFSRGEKVWTRADIEVVSVRDGAGRPSTLKSIDAAAARAADAGRADGRRLLFHGLMGSKTGISAPSPELLVGLAAQEDCDVVLDSCQGRYDAKALGALVRAGCMAQISGSKFFTGPAFSGALLIPGALRPRRAATARLLAEAPGFAATSYWPASWSDADAPASFGPLLRWSGALIEAALFAAAPLDLARDAFDAFCSALRLKLDACPHLVAQAPPHVRAAEGDHPGFADFAGRSIICFACRVADGQGGLRQLDFAETERLFRALNSDVEARLSDLSPLDAALARQPMHIGQPVDLMPGASPPHVILRLVIGARFFSAIAMAADCWRAALDAEIADAERALDKAELLLRHWNQASGRY